MKIICLKLSSGEELIARRHADMLTESDGVNTPVLYSDVHIINLVPMKNGEFAINFIPWAVGCDRGAKMSINANHITSKYDAGAELEKGFLQQISGIQLAAAGSVPGVK